MNFILINMSEREIKQGFFQRVWDLYYDGFRNMTVGKSLWILIIV